LSAARLDTGFQRQKTEMLEVDGRVAESEKMRSQAQALSRKPGSLAQVAGLFPTSGFRPAFAYHLWRLFQESPDPVIGLEPSLYFETQILLFGASPAHKGAPLFNRKLNCFREKFDVASRVTHHGIDRVTLTNSLKATCHRCVTDKASSGS
jgi:hypothetical protein